MSSTYWVCDAGEDQLLLPDQQRQDAGHGDPVPARRLGTMLVVSFRGKVSFSVVRTAMVSPTPPSW